jgi:hypothetical protein
MKRLNRESVAVPADAGGPAEPGGAGTPEAARRPLRELVDDRLLDELLERSRDDAGGLRLTGEGSVLGELVKAVSVLSAWHPVEMAATARRTGIDHLICMVGVAATRLPGRDGSRTALH